MLPRLISRSIAAALGTLSIPLMFLVGRRLFSSRAGLLAAGFLAIAFLHVRDSHFGVTDVPMTFMVLLAFFATISMPAGQARWWRVAIAAVACGLATSTKYNAALIVVPLAIAVWQRAGSRWLYAIIVAGFVAGFLTGTPYALIARQKFVADVLGLQSHLAGGHGPDEGFGWVHHLTFSLRYGLGLPLLVISLVGLVWLAAGERRMAFLVLAFPVLYYVGMGSGRTVFMRHMTPVVPFAVLLAGFAIDRAAAALATYAPPFRPLASVLAAAMAMAVGFDSASRSIALDRLLSQPDSRAVAAALLKARYYPRGASVFQNGSVYGQVPLVPEGIYPVLPPDRLPQLVIVQTSPLTAYSDRPADLAATITGHYQPLMRIDVERPGAASREAIFDQQDAFYVPVVGFERFVRPGPAIEVFERRENP